MPVSAKLVKFTDALPVFVIPIPCPALVVPVFCAANVRLDGEKLNVNVCVWPVPVRPTVCGLPVALSVNVKLAVRVPFAVGLKVTDTVHPLPDVSVAGQLLLEIV